MSARSGKLTCWYMIPEFIIGFPPYDIPDVAEYLKGELDKEFIYFEFFEPNIFYISWETDKIKPIR